MQDWCEQRGVSRGEILSLAQVWELSKAWYHNRMSPAFRGRTADEAMRIFAGLGLTGSFWQV